MSPFFIGDLAVKMFFAWMAVGMVLYLSCYGRRKGLTLE